MQIHLYENVLRVYTHIYMFTFSLEKTGKYCGYPELCTSFFNELALNLNSFFRQS